MEDGVEHSVSPLHVTSGKLPHSLENRVPVAVLFGEDRQNYRGRRSSHQILADLHISLLAGPQRKERRPVHSTIIHSTVRYVNSALSSQATTSANLLPPFEF